MKFHVLDLQVLTIGLGLPSLKLKEAALGSL
jgi:hypothetical protein